MKFTFNISSVSRNERVWHSELHVKPLRHQHDQHVHRVKVAVLNGNGRIEGETITYRLSAKSKTYAGYLVFDATDIVKDVLRKTKNDFEKVVRITIKHSESHPRKGGGKLISKRSAHENLSEDDGILILYTENESFFQGFKSQMKYAAAKVESTKNPGFNGKLQSRKKRSSSNKDGNLCTKRDLSINFEDLGWSQWIVFPHTYNAFMCEGRCPTPVGWTFDPTNHSILQSLARLKNKNIPRPCCAPTQLDSISMMYYENDELVVRHHKEMKVDSCGCR